MLCEKRQVFKIALGVEYNGSGYYGWQSQQKLCSVQEKLENALAKIANHSIRIFCAGRTDVGVHSTGQVVHFLTTSNRLDSAWTVGVNANLPADIAIRWVKRVPFDFHARFSAIARYYRYAIYNKRLRSAIMNKTLTHFSRPLDIAKMLRSGRCLIGEKDFTSFRSTQCQSRTPFRNIMYFNVFRRGPYVIIDIKANAFLRHMVRNIVGSLMQIGCGRHPEDWLETLLAAKDRKVAAATAKPEGLYLIGVEYPSHFALPTYVTQPLFFIN
ncbi:tRNA pseudouridine(38-40) synthase TruA [Candidatus Pantoea carbekii]|uniref:tRNA pseudouridine synthase A n=1 Tax=Candidatus Pantoea carbekii TaxID=1235990 RepID=U3U2X6_9GAMM|nr:tRNA pseudouridine(38-40) synthase TruA [Candidatus Pantoea carbekii]AKC31985.1 tRNA pseudouridine synthase A TruA [Candidatus Pantoea carbekii]BAO00506.1 TruA protein [Candidatus Pantoea carbekii]